MKNALKVLCSLLLALCLVFAFAACNDNGQDDNNNTNPPITDGDNTGDKDDEDDDPPQVVEKTYYDVTVVNGTIKDTTYNHDKVEENQSVTVVADDAIGADTFTHWEVGGESVSTDESYTFTVTESVTVTAVYGTEFSVWDGVYPEDAPDTYSEDEENRVVHIGSAEAFAYWADMITNAQDGTDRTQYKYSTFDWGVYTREYNNNGGDVDAAVKSAMKPDNQWTVSIDCNIDLAGYEWTPIFDISYGQHEIIYEGNGHIIKNLYVTAYADGEFVANTMKAAGLFGVVAGSNMHFRNITFDSALSEAQNLDAGMQNMAVVVGYMNANNHYDYFKDHQVISFENVNVINSSVIGSGNTKKQGFLIGRVGAGTETMNDHTKEHVIIGGCIFSNNLIVGSSILGGILGHIYTGDENINERNIHIIDIYSCALLNITAISYDNGSATNNSWQFGTLGCWDQLVWSDPSGYGGTPSWIQNPVNYDIGSPFVNFIDLHVGTGATSGSSVTYSPVNTNEAVMKATLEAVDDEGNPMVKDIFVAADLTFDPDSLGYPDWTGNAEQTIYLVGGVTLEGLDTTGSAVRYIDGTRNASGQLNVKDADGNVVGAWVITDYAGAFVAAE